MKADLTDRQIAEYFRRSYTAVDGLWFMKVEGKWGFEAALKADEEVWRVQPKIQARMLKAMMGLDNGIQGLRRAVLTRLAIEGFEFNVEDVQDGLRFKIERCPWHDLLLRSGRENLSERIGDLICGTENDIWASEFGDISFKRSRRICRGDEICILCFLENAKMP